MGRICQVKILEEYDDIFAELHEKYAEKAKDGTRTQIIIYVRR